MPILNRNPEDGSSKQHPQCGHLSACDDTEPRHSSQICRAIEVAPLLHLRVHDCRLFFPHQNELFSRLAKTAPFVRQVLFSQFAAIWSRCPVDCNHGSLYSLFVLIEHIVSSIMQNLTNPGIYSQMPSACGVLPLGSISFGASHVDVCIKSHAVMISFLFTNSNEQLPEKIRTFSLILKCKPLTIGWMSLSSVSSDGASITKGVKVNDNSASTRPFSDAIRQTDRLRGWAFFVSTQPVEPCWFAPGFFRLWRMS